MQRLIRRADSPPARPARRRAPRLPPFLGAALRINISRMSRGALAHTQLKKPAERADHQVTITPGRGHAGGARRPPGAVSDLLDALQAALKAANPEEIVTRNLSLRG